MPEAGMQTSLAGPGSGGPDGRKTGRADLEIVQNEAWFNDGRFRVTTEAKLRPLARFGCSMVSRLISAFIEASRVNETVRRLHFSTPDKSGPGDGYGWRLFFRHRHLNGWCQYYRERCVLRKCRS